MSLHAEHVTAEGPAWYGSPPRSWLKAVFYCVLESLAFIKSPFPWCVNILVYVISRSCAASGCDQKFNTKSNLKKHFERKHENQQKQYAVSTILYAKRFYAYCLCFSNFHHPNFVRYLNLVRHGCHNDGVILKANIVLTTLLLDDPK